MKASRLVPIGLVLLLAALLFASQAAAQGRGRARNQQREYDPASEATMTAIVQEVAIENRQGTPGVHLVLQAEEGPVVAHLGPESYLADLGAGFAAGESVTVTGSRATIDGEPALIVREIRRGDASWTLRDAAGTPAWRGEGWRAADGDRGRGRGRGRASVADRSAGTRPRAAGAGRGRTASTAAAGSEDRRPGSGARRGMRWSDAATDAAPAGERRRAGRNCPCRGSRAIEG